jgi:itaconyl-CoA hydratase
MNPTRLTRVRSWLFTPATRPTQGIVTVSIRGVNQNGVEVMTFERTMLIYKRGHSPEQAANY